jgi:hypothetical protein
MVRSLGDPKRTSAEGPTMSANGNPLVVIRDDERSDPVEIKLVESGPLWVEAMRQELSAKGCSSSVEF